MWGWTAPDTRRTHMSDPQQTLGPGTKAPDFTLSDGPNHTISLKNYRGQPVILCFYPADFSSVCGEQVVLYNELLPEFRRYDAQILGISVDGIWCHKAFAESRKLQFPLLADFEPKGAVARQYGVYRDENGITERALFVIDAEGTVQWSYVSPIGTNPGADGILQALDRLGGETAAPTPADEQAPASDDTDTPPPTPTARHVHARGPEDASMTLLEYLDFECPDCLDAYKVLHNLPQDVWANVRQEVRNFPLRHAHPHAQHAAEAAEAAAAQGKFWEMYDHLFQHQDALADDNLMDYARAIGLDEAQFKQDLASHTYADAVEQERLQGARDGVNGTPTFFINGTRYDGEVTAEALTAALKG